MKKTLTGLGLALIVVILLGLAGCGSGSDGVSSTPVEVPQIPADAAFTPPTGFSSVAFPKQGPTVNLTLTSFAAGSTAYLYLMNFSDSSVTTAYSVAAGTVASSRIAVQSGQSDNEPISPQHLFHLRLRQKAALVPPPVAVAENGLRVGMRSAIQVGSQSAFSVYVTNSDSPVTINATCRRSDSIADTTKKVHFFVDNNDTGMSNLDSLIGTLATNWAGIYVKNRSIFGDEPTGILSSGVDATDFYILLSRRVYTAGYFYTGDLSSVQQIPDSNMKKMFNLQLPAAISTSSGVNSITIVANELSATMAHEFQHMIHYQQRGNSSNSWLEEAMSGYAEYANGYRIETANNQSKALQANQYFALISQVTFNKWHGSNDSSAVVNAYYGKAYLFGIWLAQNYGSNGSVRTLLTQQGNDKAAIVAFSGLSLEEVFARFMLALSVNDSLNGGIYGIKGLNLTATYSFGASLASITLTGPKTTGVNAAAGGSASITLPAYSAAYVKISSGDGKTINVTATLPQYSAVYQLRKN